jgi:predicted nucleic acid-binding protein
VIVADASVIVSFVLEEPGWENYIDILEYCFTVDHAVKEVLNAIWKSYRNGVLSLEEAVLKSQVLKKMINVNVLLFDEVDLLDEAFKISLGHNITVYDALYIALALKLGKPFATLDLRQRRVAEALGLSLVDLSAVT